MCLCEKGDLAQGTSSASTKLIHGGLRYLEHYDFALVRESLREREILLRMGPHIIWPLPFIIPYVDGMRPKWMIRAGLFLYDHLSGKHSLPASRKIDLRKHQAGEALEGVFDTGFIYSDCWVQDTRLVILNAMDARDKGAVILPRTECTKASRREGKWEITLHDHLAGNDYTIKARALVNAAGPWAGQVAKEVIGVNSHIALRPVKGSHIVIHKQYSRSFAYVLQQEDKRIVFAIPYEGEFTLVGTTEVPYTGDPQHVSITEEEKQYLCDAVNGYFADEVTLEDICWSYAGVRPLPDDGSGSMSAISREYVLEWEGRSGEAPLLNVYGGKLTTYRSLAEKAVGKLAPMLGNNAKDWTADSVLPGGNIAGLAKNLKHHYPWLPKALAKYYMRHYGALSFQLLGNAKSLSDLGKDLGGGLLEAEAAYLRMYEWAVTEEDMLWRRTKRGLMNDASDRIAEAI